MGLFLYRYGLPYILTHNTVIEYTSKFVKKNFSVDLVLKNPSLITDFNSGISVSFDDFSLIDKNNVTLFKIEDFSTKFYLKDIIFYHIKPEYLNSKTVFMDLSGLIDTFVPQNPVQSTAPNNLVLDIFNTKFDIKNVLITYNLLEKEDCKIVIKDLKRSDKFINFTSDIDVLLLNLKLKNKDKLYIENGKLYFDDFVINHKSEKIVLTGWSDDFLTNKNFDYDIAIKGNKITFNELKLGTLENFDGNTDIDIRLTQKDFYGGMVFNDIYIKDGLTGISIAIPNFKTGFDTKHLKIHKINGYFCDYPKNKFDIEISVNNYLKRNMTYNGLVNIDFTSEFAKEFLTKKFGYEVGVVGVPNFKFIFNGDYKKLDLTALYKMDAGEDFLIAGKGLGLSDKERVMIAKIEANAKKLILKSFDFVVTFIDKNKKERRTPIVGFHADWDISKAGLDLQTLGFKIHRFIPAEFFNAITNQRTLRRGLIKGQLEIDNRGNIPKIKGALTLDKVRIPAERIFIKTMSFVADDKFINILADGKYKKSAFEVKSKIENKLIFPLHVKDMVLSIDDIDVEKMLSNRNVSKTEQVTTPDEEGEIGDEVEAFDIGNIIVEKANVIINKGVYKEVNFGNLNATASLDKNSHFVLTSNKFDIADGYSGLNFSGNLKENVFKLILGAKNVNSQKLAAAFLGLKNEISGEANGLIDLTIDNSNADLSGKIVFNVKKGQMFLLGFAEYIMRAVNTFRNPLLSLNLNNLIGLVKSDKGDFDSVSGELIIDKNVITDMKIKTQSDTLATYIVGKYGLLDFDADLKIFTKFSRNNRTKLGAFGDFSLLGTSSHLANEMNSDFSLYREYILDIPQIDVHNKDVSIYLIKVDGDILSENYLSSVKKIK